MSTPPSSFSTIQKHEKRLKKPLKQLCDGPTDQPTNQEVAQVVNECHKIIQTHLTCLYIVEKALLTTLLRMDQKTDRPMD